MDETSKSFIKWEKFLRKNPSLTDAYEADPNIFAKLLANQEEFEKKVKNILQCYRTETIDKVNDFFYI